MVLKIPQLVCSGFNFFSHRSLDQIGLCTKNELEFQTWSLKLLGRGVGGGWGWIFGGLYPPQATRWAVVDCVCWRALMQKTRFYFLVPAPGEWYKPLWDEKKLVYCPAGFLTLHKSTQPEHQAKLSGRQRWTLLQESRSTQNHVPGCLSQPFLKGAHGAQQQQ